MKSFKVVAAVLVAVAAAVAIAGVISVSAQVPPYVEVQGLLFPESTAAERTETVSGILCWAAPYLTPSSDRPDVCTHWPENSDIWARWTPDQIEMARGAANGVALWGTGAFTLTYEDGIEQVCSSAVLTAARYHIEIPAGVEVGEGPLWGGDNPDCTHIPQATENGIEVAVLGTTPATLQLLVDGNEEWEGLANSDPLFIPVRTPYNNWVEISTVAQSYAGKTEQDHGYMWFGETQPYPEIDSFDVFPTSGEEPLQVTATAELTGAAPLVVIDWGDQSDISTIAEPEGALTETHVFSEGTFTVQSWTVDQYGVAGTTVSETVTVTSTTPGDDDDEDGTVYIFIPLVSKPAKPKEPKVTLSGEVLFFPEKPVQKTTRDAHGNPCTAAPYTTENSLVLELCTQWTGPGEVWAEWTPEQIAIAQGDSESVALWGSRQFTVTYADGTEKICGSALLTSDLYHLQIPEGVRVGEGVLLEGDTTDCNYIAPVADQTQLSLTVTGQAPVTVTVLAGGNPLWEGAITEAGTSSISLSLPKGWSEIETTAKSALFEEIHTHGWLWGGD